MSDWRPLDLERRPSHSGLLGFYIQFHGRNGREAAPCQHESANRTRGQNRRSFIGGEMEGKQKTKRIWLFLKTQKRNRSRTNRLSSTRLDWNGSCFGRRSCKMSRHRRGGKEKQNKKKSPMESVLYTSTNHFKNAIQILPLTPPPLLPTSGTVLICEITIDGAGDARLQTAAARGIICASACSSSVFAWRSSSTCEQRRTSSRHANEGGVGGTARRDKHRRLSLVC